MNAYSLHPFVGNIHGNNMSLRILFRCDGSVELGMGHVVRCLALADHLKENHDCFIKFAMRKSELGIKRIKEKYPVLESNEKNFSYKEWLTNCIEKTNADILIMDMHDVIELLKLHPEWSNVNQHLIGSEGYEEFWN